MCPQSVHGFKSEARPIVDLPQFERPPKFIRLPASHMPGAFFIEIT